MIAPRWRKVWRDIWSNKTRLTLVVLSIAVGVSAIGMVKGGHILLTREMSATYATVNPASAMMFMSGFGDTLLQTARRTPGVESAEGRASATVRLKVGMGKDGSVEWRNLSLTAISDYKNIQINKIFTQSGDWPPPKHAILIERASLGLTNARVGDVVEIELPSGKQLREIKIAGLVHDMNQPGGVFSNQVAGFVTFETMEWLGFSQNYDQLQIRVSGDKLSKDHITAVTKELENKFERSGATVYYTYIPEPGKHWFEPYMTPMNALLEVMGIIALVLSGFLVTNTISALLTQQVRQIGVMKAIGAQMGQIMTLYLGTVVIYGLLALAVAVPLGYLGARANTQLLVSLINFDIVNYNIPLQVLYLQIAVSLLVPMLAALIPVINGTRITIREAISSYGLGKGRFGTGRIDQLVSKVRGLSRPLLISLRNTIRRKGRLALTLITLSLGSAIFISVITVHASLLRTLDDALRYFNYEIQLGFNRYYRIEQIQNQVMQVPGVKVVEIWAEESTRRMRADGSSSDTFAIIAPPSGTQLIIPTLVDGRWLLPDDENAIVINTDVLRTEPDIKVGDEITLKVRDRDTKWRVVGISRALLTNPPLLYTNYSYLSHMTGDVGRAGFAFIKLADTSPIFQAQTAKTMESRLKQAGMQVSNIQTTAELRQLITLQFNVIITFLLTMAMLLAVVGGLGLMGTMSLNVLERTREIGVMRAIGASDGAIQRIVMSEGIMIGLISFVLGTLVALPVSYALCAQVGQSFLRSPLSYTFSYSGMLLWLGLVIVISLLASLLPARSASHLSVRETLAYE